MQPRVLFVLAACLLAAAGESRRGVASRVSVWRCRMLASAAKLAAASELPAGGGAGKCFCC
jgi:hypothetical protein